MFSKCIFFSLQNNMIDIFCNCCFYFILVKTYACFSMLMYSIEYRGIDV